MPYEVVFPSKRVEREFEKALRKIPSDDQRAIVQSIRSLSTEPHPPGKRSKKLMGGVVVSHFTAQYRLRIGPYRVLYDVDEHSKRVILFKLAKRDEHTYR